jgi:hypothetical protein
MYTQAMLSQQKKIKIKSGFLPARARYLQVLIVHLRARSLVIEYRIIGENTASITHNGREL